MDAERRRLLVVRHAKSAWPPGVPDLRRPLGPRGQDDAPRVGTRIRELVGSVDVAVVSPAQRTQETWALLVGTLGEVADVRSDDRIYRDWGAGLLDVVADLPAGAGTALVLGHEPGVSELVLGLVGHGDPRLRERVATKFPTGAVALLTIDGDWRAVRPRSATLEAFVTPKELRDP